MLREADNQILVRYLLGELSEPEQEGIEDHYFSDIAVFEKLLVVEDELIDAYVNGELSREERNRFEDYFLQSPERREKVEFAEAWRIFIERHYESGGHQPAPNNESIFKRKEFLLPLAASVILALGATWLLVGRIRLAGELDRAQSALIDIEERHRSLEAQVGEQSARNEELASALAEAQARNAATSKDQSSSQPPSSAIVSLILSSALVRGSAGSSQIRIAPGTRQVRLRASFSSGDYTRFKAVLKTLAGREIHRWTELQPRIRQNIGTLALTLPADLLSDGDYIVTVAGATASGAEEVIEEYAFRVVGK